MCRVRAAAGRDVVSKPIFWLRRVSGITRLQDPGAGRAQRSGSLVQLGSIVYLQQFVLHDGWDLRMPQSLDAKCLQCGASNRLDCAHQHQPRRSRRGDFDVSRRMGRAGAAAPPTVVAPPIAGVDLLVGHDGNTYVIEVNAVPGWRCTSPNRIVLMSPPSSSRSSPKPMSIAADRALNVAWRLDEMARLIAASDRDCRTDEAGCSTASESIAPLTFRPTGRRQRLVSLRGLAGWGRRARHAAGADGAAEHRFHRAGLCDVQERRGHGADRPRHGPPEPIRCLAEASPKDSSASRWSRQSRALRRRFPKAKYNVTVGRTAWWGGKTTRRLAPAGEWSPFEHCHQRPPTTGRDHLHQRQHRAAQGRALSRTATSTARSTEIRDFYGIQPGEIDLPGFPLFAPVQRRDGRDDRHSRHGPHAAGATSIPRNIIEAVSDWHVTQSLRLAGDVEPRRPILQRARHSPAVAAARALGRRAGSGARAGADEGRHRIRRRRAHALRRDRSAARRVDRRREVLARNLAADRPRQRNVRRPPLSRHRMAGRSASPMGRSLASTKPKNCRRARSAS